MSIQSNTKPGFPTVKDRQGHNEKQKLTGTKANNPPDRHTEGIKSMPKENAFDGERPKTPHKIIKADKRGHQNKKDYDRMHERESLPGDNEKAIRKYRAKDTPKGADARRSNPDRERASR